MCTVTWREASEESAFELFFSRDEQRDRAAAQQPQVCEVGDQRALFPIDPVGGGTWLGGNDLGLVVCVLNDYRSALLRPDGLKSRGLLVREACGRRTLTEVDQFVKAEVQANEYAPFRLLCFEKATGNRRLWGWNQEELQEVDGFPCPVTSSSWKSETVERRRCELFNEFVIEAGGTLEEFHRHQFPQETEAAVCMSRKSTQTVSLTQVRIDNTQLIMGYAIRNGEASFDDTKEYSLPLKNL